MRSMQPRLGRYSVPLQHDVELCGVLVGERCPEVAPDVRKRHRHTAVEKRQGHHGRQQPTPGLVFLHPGGYAKIKETQQTPGGCAQSDTLVVKPTLKV